MIDLTVYFLTLTAFSIAAIFYDRIVARIEGRKRWAEYVAYRKTRGEDLS